MKLILQFRGMKSSNGKQFLNLSINEKNRSCQLDNSLRLIEQIARQLFFKTMSDHGGGAERRENEKKKKRKKKRG